MILHASDESHLLSISLMSASCRGVTSLTLKGHMLS